ncbi:Abi-like protein [Bifidobacterium actinocoloniiforme DSM 22766]|uniref:Abi-like protein n=1 Tax=Bifidobacterium actinocoloniiforme DSM 22766 TaxID=1437605 RepID=A0A086YYD0_9BIFI|nr:Abi family protein [Bifidobacterium actinocoloniiforme]KFI39280.1 Abi-like protein [Bifidobacterium actinocoloniiforme DSM 22766]
MDKPFTGITDQVRILQGRGLGVDDEPSHVLAREGYYQVVNGYNQPFLKTNRNQPDKYRDGVEFRQIYALFCFDRELRMLVFKYCEQAEAKLRTVCSYVFTERHPDEKHPYLNTANYRSTGDSYHTADWYMERVGDLIGTFRHVIGLQPYDRPLFEKDYIRFYLREHGHVPLWVLANSLSLGSMFKFFCYQTDSTRNAIAHEYSRQYGFDHSGQARFYFHDLRRCYNHIKDFRNICAHDERLYCARVDPSKGTSVAVLLKDLDAVLTAESSRELRTSLINLVQSLFGRVPDYVFEHITSGMGFPDKAFASITSDVVN